MTLDFSSDTIAGTPRYNRDAVSVIYVCPRNHDCTSILSRYSIDTAAVRNSYRRNSSPIQSCAVETTCQWQCLSSQSSFTRCRPKQSHVCISTEAMLNRYYAVVPLLNRFYRSLQMRQTAISSGADACYWNALRNRCHKSHWATSFSVAFVARFYSYCSLRTLLIDSNSK